MKIFSSTAYAFAALLLIVASASVSVSQLPSKTPAPTPPPRPIDGAKNPDDIPLTTFEEELRAKREIRMAEKEHQENLSRAREIGELAKQLKDKSSLDRDCLKKV